MGVPAAASPGGRNLWRHEGTELLGGGEEPWGLEGIEFYIGFLALQRPWERNLCFEELIYP